MFIALRTDYFNCLQKWLSHFNCNSTYEWHKIGTRLSLEKGQRLSYCWSYNGFKGTVVNRAFPSLHKVTRKWRLNPLNMFKENIIFMKFFFNLKCVRCSTNAPILKIIANWLHCLVNKVRYPLKYLFETFEDIWLFRSSTKIYV